VPEGCDNPPDCNEELLHDDCAAEAKYIEVKNPASALPLFRPVPSGTFESIDNEAKDQMAGIKQSIQDLKLPLSEMVFLAADEKRVSSSDCLTSSASAHTPEEREARIMPSRSSLTEASPFARQSQDFRSLLSPACRKLQLEEFRDMPVVNQIWEKVGSLEQRMNKLEVRLFRSLDLLRDEVDQKLASYSQRKRTCKDRAEPITKHALFQPLSTARCERVGPRIEKGAEFDIPGKMQRAMHPSLMTDLLHPWDVLSSAQVLDEHLPIDKIKHHNEILEGLVEQLSVMDASTLHSKRYDNSEGSELTLNNSPRTCSPKPSAPETENENELEESYAEELEDWIPNECSPEEQRLMPQKVGCSAASAPRAPGPSGSRYISV